MPVRSVYLLITSPIASMNFVEANGRMSSRIEHHFDKHNFKVLLVTGIGENDGKSTVAANICLSFVEKNKKVLLIDGDFRKPAQYKIFDKEVLDTNPLQDVITEKKSLKDSIYFNKKSNIYELFLYHAIDDPSKLMNVVTLKKIMDQLKKHFDYIVIDCSPVAVSVDAEVWMEVVDSTILLVRQDCTDIRMVNDTVDLIWQSGCDFTGFALNMFIDDEIRHNDYGYSYYDYKNDLLIDENDYLISKVFKNPSLLDNVTPKGLYDTYNKIISGSPLVYLIGNVDVDKSKELIKKILLNNKISKVRFKMDYYVYAKCIPDKVDVITEDSSFSTVGVYCNYKVRNINSVRDTVLLSVVKNLLYSNVSNILFDSLRKDNDLVYRCYARYTKFGTLTLASFTDKGNFKMIFDIYNDVMKVIEDINYIEDKLPLIIENARIDNELSKENLGDILYEHIDKHLEYVKDKYYDILKTITKEEVSDFIKNRLVMVSKYVGGDK